MKTSKDYKKQEDYYSLMRNNGNDEVCYLRFSQCDDNKHQMWRLNSEEIKKFIAYAKRIEKLKWQEILQYHGLKYERIYNLQIPDYLDKNTAIYSMRVDDKFRILGYRNERDFYIVWFDNNHETC